MSEKFKEYKKDLIETCSKRYLIEQVKNQERTDGWYQVMTEICDLEKVFYKELNPKEQIRLLTKQLEVGSLRVPEDEMDTFSQYILQESIGNVADKDRTLKGCIEGASLVEIGDVILQSYETTRNNILDKKTKKPQKKELKIGYIKKLKEFHNSINTVVPVRFDTYRVERHLSDPKGSIWTHNESLQVLREIKEKAGKVDDLIRKAYPLQKKDKQIRKKRRWKEVTD